MAIACKRVDVSLEKRVLIGFIVSTDFIKKINPIYKKDFLTSHASRLIAKWCLEHYNKYDQAPNKHITDIYVENKHKQTFDEDDEEFIENILSSLSDEWESVALSFDSRKLVDQAVDFFNERSAVLLQEKIEQFIENKDIESFQKEVAEFKPVQICDAAYFNPLIDEGKIRTAFSQLAQPLFKMPGKLGMYMNAQLYKGAFIAFQAPEKTGKSYILQEFVMRAMRNRVKVAFFELGDLTENDRICRIGSYVAKQPFDRSSIEDVVTCRIPELIEVDDDYVVKINEVPYPMLSADDAISAGKKWAKRCGSDIIRVSPHSSDSAGIEDIHNILLTWKDVDGWVPDFIAIDYADIAKKPKGISGMSERDRINEVWKAMRRLSQDWNALVMTVTQADAKSYGKAAQTRKNFSDDKRKQGHVTALYAINQTLQEKLQNTYRIAELMTREGRTKENIHIAIVHCLDLGRPYMFSYEVEASKFQDVDEDEDE